MLERNCDADSRPSVDVSGKKLLLLGGFDPHRKVVNAAHELGVYVIATDYLELEDAPAKQLADEAWMINITDVDAIVEKCREVGVDGVLNLCSDAAQMPYFEICEKLGLPCFGTREQFEVLSDKANFKKYSAEHGLLTVPGYSLEDVRAGRVEYPVFVKPSNSRGSRGQTICKSPEQLEGAIELATSESRDGRILIEKYFDDTQDFTISYIVIDGVPRPIKIGDRYDGSKLDGMERQHICTLSPTVSIDAYNEKTAPRVIEFIEGLGIRFGGFFLQGFIKDGDVYCYDPGLRLPGSDFDLIVRDQTGFDPMKSAVLFALTGDPASCAGEPQDAYLLDGGVGVMLSLAARQGTIGAINGVDRVLADPRVHDVSIRHRVGDVISKTGDVSQRVLEFVGYLESRDEVQELLDFIYENVEVLDDEGKDMLISRARYTSDGIVVDGAADDSAASESAEALLILGAGNFQVDAIELCESLGYRVFGCSYRDTDPGIALLDGFRRIDIRDALGVTDYAREKSATAVYSVGSDIAIPSAMKASEELGLPHFISYETACTCQDKGKLRALLGQTEWSVPFTVASTADEAKAFGHYPAMMKPVDSQGQRGCFEVRSEEDIDRYFEQSAKHSNLGTVIVERYIDGPEISVNAFLRDGEVVFAMPSDRYSYSEYPGGIIKEHGLPCSVLDDRSRSDVHRLVEETTRLLGIENGPVYYQLKLDEGKPRVIEIAPRLDGCHMWRFIRHYCGYDLLAATFDLLLDRDAAPQPAPEPREGQWRLTFMNAAPGTKLDRASYDTSNSDYLQWYYETGETVKPVNGIMEKCGYRIHRVG